MDFGLDATSSSELLAQATGLFQGLWLVLIVFIGVPLGLYIISRVISLTPKKKKD